MKSQIMHVGTLLIIAIFTIASTSFSGSIAGTVTYKGKIPKFRKIKMDADPVCLAHNTDPVFPQTLVLGEGQMMANVFVHVKSGIPKKDFPAPTESVILTQKGCMYDPHVLGVMVGQPVKILNPDGTLHNVHALCKINKEFNLAMPKFRKETTKTFDKAEFMFPIKCDVHPWMGAWISVMPHPYFAVTLDDGKFQIDNLPPGEYEVEAWHEKLGGLTKKVVIADGNSQDVAFEFARPEKKE